MFSRFFAYVFFERLSYVPSWLDLIIENSPLQSFPIEFTDFLAEKNKHRNIEIIKGRFAKALFDPVN